MKKILLIVIMLTSIVFAHQQMVIHKKNGSTSIKTLNSVDSITFTSGLVAEYLFNGNAKDGSGNGNDGTVNGALLTTDRFGNDSSAYLFDGVDDFIEAKDDSLPFDSSARSISFWINNNSDSINNESVVCYGINNDGELFCVQVQNEQQTFRKIRIGIHKTSVTHSDSLVPTDNWVHIAVTTDDSLNYKIYINAKIAGSGIIAQPFNTVSNGILRFGKRSISANPNFFNGKIDDIRIFNRALTFNEIECLYKEKN